MEISRELSMMVEDNDGNWVKMVFMIRFNTELRLGVDGDARYSVKVCTHK